MTPWIAAAVRISLSGYSLSSGFGGPVWSPGAARAHTFLKISEASSPATIELMRPNGRYRIFAGVLPGSRPVHSSASPQPYEDYGRGDMGGVFLDVVYLGGGTLLHIELVLQGVDRAAEIIAGLLDVGFGFADAGSVVIRRCDGGPP